MKTTTDTKLALGMPSEFWRCNGGMNIFMALPDGGGAFDLGGNLRLDALVRAAKLVPAARFEDAS